MRPRHKGAGGCHIPHSGLNRQARGSKPRAFVAGETGLRTPAWGFPNGLPTVCVTFLSVFNCKRLAGTLMDPRSQSSTGVTSHY